MNRAPGTVKRRPLLIFLLVVAATAGAMLVFIQSTYFADVLKTVARRYLPVDLGIDADFSELSVKVLPPGVVIKNPKLTFQDKNAAGLPAGTSLDARALDVTFQFFQLLTGSVTINAFMIEGATLKLEIDERFLSSQQKKLVPRKKSWLPQNLSWDSLVRFNFRSVGLLDSKIDVSLPGKDARDTVRVQALAREVTVGRSTVDKLPSYDLAVDLQDAQLDLRGLSRQVSQLKASVEISSQGVAIRNLSMQEGESNLHVNGTVRGNILERNSLKSSLSYIVRGKIDEWLKPDLLGRFMSPKFLRDPRVRDVQGSMVLEGKLTADLASFEQTLETRANIQFEALRFAGWAVDTAVIKALWKGRTLGIESAEAELGKGKVRVGKFLYDTALRSQNIQTTVELEDADLRQLVGPELDSIYPLHAKLTGTLNTELTLSAASQLRATADLRVKDFSLDNQKRNEQKPLNVLLALKEAAVKGKFSIDKEGVTIEAADATMGRSHQFAKGTVHFEKGFDLDMTGQISAADVGKLGPFELAGDGKLHWTVKGPAKAVVFTFEPDVIGARYLHLNLGAVKGKVVYSDSIDELRLQDLVALQGRSKLIANGTVDLGASDAVDMTIQVPAGTIQDFAALFSYFIEQKVPWYPHDLTGALSGTVKVSGKTDLDALSVEGPFELSNVNYKREIFRFAKVHAGYRRGAYVAERAQVQKRNGWIRGNFVFGADNVIKYDFRSEGLSTLDVDLLNSVGLAYRAPLFIEGAGEGRYGTLKSTLLMSLGEGLIKTRPISGSMLKLATDNGTWTGSTTVFGDQLRGKFSLGWKPGSMSSFEFDARGFDVRPMVIGLNPDLSDDPELDSEMTGRAKIEFPSDSWSRFTGTAALDSYVLKKRGYSLALAKPVRIEARDGNYDFHDVRFVGEGTSLVGQGRVENGQMLATLKGVLNLGVFEFLVHEIAALRGPAKVDARFSGPANRPEFRATVIGDGADLRLRSMEQPFEDIRFDVDWKNALIRVTNASAKFAGGTVKGLGTALLYANKMPDLDFKADLDNPKVKVYPVAYARTSGRVNLNGTEFPYKVTGNVVVAEALIRENFSLNEGARILRSSKFLPQKRGGAGEFQVFELGLDVSADKNVFVRNDLFDVEMKGNLKIVNSLTTPRLLGTATVLHGRLLFKDNYFQVQSGNIRFTNPAVLDPEFDMTGLTEMKGYKIILVASGSVTNYKLEFQSQPPLSQSDIVNLLTLGITASEYQGITRENRNAYSQDEMYSLLFSQSGINRTLQEKLGVNLKVGQSQIVTPENAFRAGGPNEVGETVAPKVVLQKQLTKSLNATVGSTVGVGDNQERNASLEWRFHRNVSVEGVYEDQRGTQAKQSRTSMGLDLKYKKRF